MYKRMTIGAMLLSLCILTLNLAARQKESAIIETGGDAEYAEEMPKQIALTFDDGPVPEFTEPILDYLDEKNIDATFFFMGMHVKENPETVKRAAKEGHEIGNHTYSHLQLASNNHSVYMAELQQTNQLLKELTGEQAVFFRPPFGTWNKELDRSVKMIPVLWTIDSKDWCSTDASVVAQRVIGSAKDGSIILMHDGYDSTIKALYTIVETLQGQGYEFVTVEELILE